MQGLEGLSVGMIVLVFALSAPGMSQTTTAQAINPDPDLNEFARRMPDCKEFRNACQVCSRLADGKLGCSNIGVACTPNGDWRCSVPAKTDDAAK
jgi:hypothetical protein